jgi:hypothetical protein
MFSTTKSYMDAYVEQNVIFFLNAHFRIKMKF